MGKKISFVIFIVIVALFADSYISHVWTEELHRRMISLPRQLGFVEIQYLVEWIPRFIIYALAGYICSYMLRPNPLRQISSIVIILFLFEAYSIRYGFLEDADLIDKVWAYFNYVVPSLSILIGYLLFSANKALQPTAESGG